ncbi:WLM-domain-containing protein [Apiospora rasikravindrae]|uniref:WLM-domain-containing protein n=1 Tax=Apiospora rasikravindrae TaxID=990691 RepID=A0ABR1UD38_9PEZI
MPLGIQRINAKKSQPNSLVVFIKPLKGPDESVAQDFLERIAAQCLPIMKKHHLSVMSLEEYEPNREFVGRNFNAGEVIQLVLKSPSTGRWLPFHYVQMVMMHELAHCKQMNHSKAFWAVRNGYADEMRTLWSNGYTGRGPGEFENNAVLPGEGLPEHLCGGTYRSRRRKRKPKAQLSYQERKQRRILKKFGANGVALGEDDEVKAGLEKGKRTASKPRVAGSKRGRELRAAAALARFDQQKKTEEEPKLKKEEDVVDLDDDETSSGNESETASDSEDDLPADTDVNGQQILDRKGHRMVKVCEDENPDAPDAQQELRELQQSSIGRAPKVHAAPTTTKATTTTTKNPTTINTKSTKSTPGGSIGKTAELGDGRLPNVTARSEKSKPAAPRDKSGACPMCSFENGPDPITCSICSHVLVPQKDPAAWKCSDARCNDSQYLNAGDSSLCGVCGERKPA